MQLDDYDLAPKLRWIWWTARFLVVTGILLCAFVLLSAYDEIADTRHPFLLDGNPFGTFGKPARLGTLVLAIVFAIALIGYIISFWRERIAARFLLASGIIQIILAAIWRLSDPTRPIKSYIGALLIGILPPVVPGVLFLVLLRKANPNISPKHGNSAV